MKISGYFCAIILAAILQYVVNDMSCCTFAQEQGSGLNATAIQPLTAPEPHKVGWIIEDKVNLAVSEETNKPISGNSSLRVNVLQASDVNQTIDSPWSVISTDFIPVGNSSRHEFSLDVSAKDVNQLHSKVYYYDKNKFEIINLTEYAIFWGIDGTFEDSFTSTFSTPKDAEYLKLQMWVRKSLSPSFFILDNVKIEMVSSDTK